ncbi:MULTISPECIES: Lrp/AsnC family transcriptional regulator [unclassified Motilimonas]|uniref:Lrp/AsnC family transcriptional regulator n=1 Tax=Motilimonas TaxID=1914248 RepID=UPI001E2E3E3A|nr:MULTISPECIES: Lrp/AsnC family transcriptional regulator [unclassified Motilimonas]MCE0558046.1 Lrp/AsnC family transcriptional regulator [Motilimonas sp. E26]MDO6526051.1 Lrp/AsnC family transcriptional regulator [Motilimonas sp. 1_MG-2023]
MLDRVDLKILALLQRDVSLSVSDIAEQVNLTTTPCWKRIKRLQDEGVIRHKVALLDPLQLNLDLTAMVQVKTQQHSVAWSEAFLLQIKDLNEVMECYRMAGEYDYMLKVVVKDMRSFDAFYKKLVNRVSGLTEVTSSFAMEQLKYTTELPLSSALIKEEQPIQS